MARKHPPFTPEFRRQMIELVRCGRSPESLAKEFEPTAQAIRIMTIQRVLLGSEIFDQSNTYANGATAGSFIEEGTSLLSG